MQSTRGIIYLGVGEPHARKVARSIQFLRAAGNEDAIAVITDQPTFFSTSVDFVVQVEGIDHRHDSRFYKTQLHVFTPFEQTLFFDSDIIAVTNLSELWLAADSANIAMVPDGPFTTVASLLNSRKGKRLWDRGPFPSGETAHYNSGVIAFRDLPDVREFFFNWHSDWITYRGRDQPALARTLAKFSPRIQCLEEKFNWWKQSFLSISDAKNAGAVILHMHGGFGEPNRFWNFPSQLVPRTP